MPYRGQPWPDIAEYFEQVCGDDIRGRVLPQLVQIVLRRLQFAQTRFPSTFEFIGDQAVLWIRLHELTLGTLRLVTQPLHLLLVRRDHLGMFSVSRLQSRCGHIDLRHTQCRKEP